jgi:hypothetical protein
MAFNLNMYGQRLLTLEKSLLYRPQILRPFYTCLKFRQFRTIEVYATLIALLLVLSGCGAKSPNQKVRKDFYQKEIELLIIEKQCKDPQGSLSPVTTEINQLYADTLKVNPMAFLFVPPNLYDYQNPLKISASTLEKELFSVQTKLHTSPDITLIASELFYLYQNANRFESLKCSFDSMVQKKTLDYRSMKVLEDFCQEKNGSALCSDQALAQLTVVEEDFVEEKTLALCRSFSKDVNCQTEWNIGQKSGSKGRIVRTYQDRFHKERFDKLFSLRSNHLRFHCAETIDEAIPKTFMNIKVYKGTWDEVTLKTLLKYVSDQWSNASYQLQFEVVNQTDIVGESVVTILNTTNFNSYVPDNNTRVVYLSEKLDFLTKQKVLAHEFGHVLGFPDCYVEFFDDKEKELVYYEHSKTDTNIMCSLKSNVRAPDQYLRQLREKSCLFP